MSFHAKPPTPEPVPPAPPVLDADTRDRVRAKARQIARRAGLCHSDESDVEQEITLHVWRRLGRFDRAKADDRGAFVRMLVAHAVSTVLRGRARRARRAPASLEAVLRQGCDPVDPDSLLRQGRVALALDVAAVLAVLPRRLRRVAEALGTRSVSAAARHLGLSRAAVYRRLAELRAAFAAAGLDGFL